MVAGLSALSAYSVGNIAHDDADSDAESEIAEEVTGTANRMMLRLQLRRWEAQFVKTENRTATYEDKKLDRTYQELRSQLRQAELAWRAARQQRAAYEDWDGSMSSFSGGGHSSRRSSGHSSKRMTIGERERMDERLRSLREQMSSSHRVGLSGRSMTAGCTRRSDATTAFSCRLAKGDVVRSGLKANVMACSGGADRRAVYSNVAARAAIVDRTAAMHARRARGDAVGSEGSSGAAGKLHRLQSQHPQGDVLTVEGQAQAQQLSCSDVQLGVNQAQMDEGPTVEAPPKKKRARFADDAEEAGWRYRDGSRVEAPVKQHSQLLQALQQQARQSEAASIRGLPGRIAEALAKVHVALRGRAPPDEETAAALLRGFLADGAGEMDATFPTVLHVALVEEYTQRFGVYSSS